MWSGLAFWAGGTGTTAINSTTIDSTADSTTTTMGTLKAQIGDEPWMCQRSPSSRSCFGEAFGRNPCINPIKYVCTYIYMCVCMYVCMYVHCMHVCMYILAGIAKPPPQPDGPPPRPCGLGKVPNNNNPTWAALVQL